MNVLEPVIYGCPYCGESIETLVDRSVGELEYVEDCAVCCRPITLRILFEGVDISIQARRDDEG